MFEIMCGRNSGLTSNVKQKLKTGKTNKREKEALRSRVRVRVRV